MPQLMNVTKLLERLFESYLRFAVDTASIKGNILSAMADKVIACEKGA